MKKHSLLILSIILIIIIASANLFDTSFFTAEISEDNTFKKNNGLMSEHKKRVKGILKFDSPGLFEEYHTLIRTKAGEIAPAYKLNYKFSEFRKALIRSKKEFFDRLQNKLEWIERGPGNVGGRTRAFIVDPYDETNKTWFAGSSAGGIWKTTDMGFSWRNMTPDIPNLATTTLAYSSANPDIIYAGTGEGFMNLDAVNGDGIFKSTDHGETWFQLESTASFRSINRIVVDPKNPDNLLCCSNDMNISSNNSQRYFNARNSTIQRTTNGGISWTKVYEAGADRIQQIVADPDDFNIQYATINSIGIIKSTNAGMTWFESSKGILGKRRIEMAIAPTNTSKLYLSVENGSKSDFYSSNDAAETWYLVNDTKKNNSWLSSQGWYDNCIAVHPYNEDIIYVGGVNIFKIEMQSGLDSVMQINEINKINTDSYMDFFDVGLPFEGGGIGTGEDIWGEKVVNDNEYTSVEIRFGPEKSQKAHRFIMNGENKYEYKDYIDVPFEVYDIDNFKQIMVSFIDNDMDGEFELAEGELAEGILIHSINYNNKPYDSISNNEKYKNTFILTPMLKEGSEWNPDELPTSRLKIIWGAVYSKIRKTVAVTDGYGQFGGPNRNNVVHVDQHNITMIPVNPDEGEYWILLGNDGGVAYSTNEGLNWTETDKNGYNTSQFYGADKSPEANEYIGGAQDNGTWQSPRGQDAEALTKYAAKIGGDGFEVAWHYKDPNKIIGTSQFNTIRRTVDGGETWQYGSYGITDGYRNGGPFVTKIAKSQIDPDLVFAVGKSGIWRSENFAASWQGIPIADSLWRSGGYYSNAQVEISKANPQIVWAGVNMSVQGKIQLSIDGGLNFASVNNFDLFPMGRLSGLESHISDENTAYALFSMAYTPKILKTTDLGQTWNDISGFDEDSVSKAGFPDVAVYCLIVMPYNNDIIWVGTEIGLFESTDNGDSWHYADNGLPAVSVWQMRIVDDQVVIATHGRGIWSVTIDELSGYKPPEATLAPAILVAGQSPTSNLVVYASLRSEYDSTLVYVRNINDSLDAESVYTLFENNIETYAFKIPYENSKTETLDVSVVSYKDGREYKTALTQAVLYPLADFQINYHNDFEEKGGFGGSGLTIDSIPGFESAALQSPHNYKNNRNIYSLLLTPIIVADTLASFIYDDIAIVEPADSGFVFGTARFWDYVVVEGTVDGFNWLPLSDGYDANYEPSWLAVYKGDTTLSQEMYRTHELNLLDIFNARDTILIRFRLYADANANGWGWAIDNINVLGELIVSVKDFTRIQNDFYISNIYPNPINGYANIEFFLSYSSDVKIDVFDEQGNFQFNLINGRMNNGSFSVKLFTDKLNSGTYFIKMDINGKSDIKKVIVIK